MQIKKYVPHQIQFRLNKQNVACNPVGFVLYVFDYVYGCYGTQKFVWGIIQGESIIQQPIQSNKLVHAPDGSHLYITKNR